MDDLRTIHEMFVVERVYAASPGQVFAWFSETERKREMVCRRSPRGYSELSA